jgi:hypothetical protein
LSEVERDLKNSASASKTKTNGKRMIIEEVENSEDEDRKESESKHEDGSTDKGKTSFLFGYAVKNYLYVTS